MTEFFLTIVNMSISASWIVLAVLLLRLLLKKAPKWITVLLWGIVAVRLVCPFSIKSALSLIPSSQTINPEVALNTPAIDSGVPIIDNVINPIIGEATITFQPEKDLNFFQFIMPYLAGLWLVGIIALLIYTVVSYVRVKRKIGTAILLQENIFQSESVVSPFVLGIIKPKIYLPFRINEQNMEHVIAHEQAHIRRKDHWWKPLGFLVLTIHWFNPLMWLGYILLCRDIEIACDEKVIKELNVEQKADYSQALLTCSVNRRVIAACPLAFGEVGVKNRVKSVLNYKKPAFWIIVVAIIASVVAAVCFLTNPINTSDKVLNKLINLEDYEVVEQEEKRITLSIPVSELSDKIYTESGKTFGVNQVIAYQDATTSIYLKEARYSNEGKDNLYFCFDFDFDLPKKQGVLLYPYEITNSGLSGSVRTVDGILKADNGEFADAIADRGQGGNELIWFYVSTDALKQTQGTIRFDVSLNEITYFLDGDDYSFASEQNIAEKIMWSYNPMLSHTSHYTRAFAFDCEYTHVDATCTGGEFWNLDAEGQPRDDEMRFENGKVVYWTPSEGVGKSADKSEITLTVYNGETKVQQHTVIFECVSRNNGTGKYEFYLKDTTDFVLVYSEEGSLTFIERSAIANVGGTDNSSEVKTTIDGNPFFLAEVLEIYDNSILVKATKDTILIKEGAEYLVSTDVINESIPVADFEIGTKIAIIYNGEIQETYPAQINSVYAIYNATEQPVAILPTVTYTDDKLGAAIATVLNDKYRAEKPDGLLHIETYYLLANETASGTPLEGNSGHMEEATVYLLVYHMKYSVKGGQLEEVEGNFVPTAITFSIDENGNHTLKDYWTPSNGANYEKDIRAKFPGESANEALNTEKYADDLIKESWRLATETLKSFEVENE